MNEYYRSIPQSLDHNRVIDAFVRNTHIYEHSTTKFSDSKPVRFNFKLFDQVINNTSPGPDQVAYVKAYFHALLRASGWTNHEIEDKILVEKSVTNVEFAMEIKHLFPKSKFVHIVRNPYSNLVSLRKYNTNLSGAPLLHRLVNLMYNSYYFLYKNSALLKEDYLVIKYEDLLTSPERTMRTMAVFLSVPFHKSLLEPTVQGESWTGNSTSDRQFKGINRENLNKWKSSISPIEIFIVNKLFHFLLEEYNYEFIPYRGGYFKRMKGESFRRYIWNRLIKILYRYY